MILQDDVLHIHELVLRQSGGGSGIRDWDILKSALARPFQTFNSSDLYTNVLEKTAALMESLIVNHAFVDGNKRTGFTIANLFLMKHGLEIEGNDDDIYRGVIAMASGQMTYEDILHWLQNNTQQL